MRPQRPMEAGCLSGLAQILRMSPACEAVLRTRLASTRRRKADNARVRQALHVPSCGCRGSQRLGRRPRSRGGASCSEHSGRGPPQRRGCHRRAPVGICRALVEKHRTGEERHKTSRNEPTKKTKKKLSRKELLRPFSERNTGALGSVIPFSGRPMGLVLVGVGGWKAAKSLLCGVRASAQYDAGVRAALSRFTEVAITCSC